MTNEQVDLLIAEQKRTNALSEAINAAMEAHLHSNQSLLQEIRRMRFDGRAVCEMDEKYKPPRYAGAALTEALQLAEKWLRDVKWVLSIGMIPSPVPGELIRALRSLPNTLSQLEPIRGEDRPDSQNGQIPT